MGATVKEPAMQQVNVYSCKNSGRLIRVLGQLHDLEYACFYSRAYVVSSPLRWAASL
jgi:hypothetical protein